MKVPWIVFYLTICHLFSFFFFLLLSSKCILRASSQVEFWNHNRKSMTRTFCTCSEKMVHYFFYSWWEIWDTLLNKHFFKFYWDLEACSVCALILIPSFSKCFSVFSLYFWIYALVSIWYFLAILCYSNLLLVTLLVPNRQHPQKSYWMGAVQQREKWWLLAQLRQSY